MLESAVRDDSGSAEAHYWLAQVSHDQGDHDKARTQADKAVELDDTYAEASSSTAICGARTNKDKAKKAYKKYLEVAPTATEAKAVKRALRQLR